MKNYQILLPLIFILIHHALRSQSAPVEWAPIGATWNYLHAGAELYFELIQLKSVKDTLIQGRTARKITQTLFHDHKGNEENLGDIYLLQEGNRVYYFTLDSFYLLYDFDAKVGDTISIINHPRIYYPDRPSATIAIIKDTSTININGSIRRTQLLSFDLSTVSSSHFTATRAIEGMGSLYYLIPYFWHAECDHLCPRLNCYTDSLIFFKNTDWPDWPCDTILPLSTISTLDRNFDNLVVLSPNPVRDGKIYIQMKDLPLNQPTYYSIYDGNGRKITSENILSGNEIEIGTYNLNAGIYLISFRSQKWSVIKKIVLMK